MNIFKIRSCFEAAHVPVEIGTEQFIIGHGNSRFIKHDKVQDMKRKARTGPSR